MSTEFFSAIAAIAAAIAALISAGAAVAQVRFTRRVEVERRAEARPHLEVMVTPIYKSTPPHFKDRGILHVEVTIENTSTRVVTLNHAGIYDCDSGATDVVSEEAVELSPGGQAPPWILDADRVVAWVAERDPRQTWLRVFASSEPPLSATDGNARTWYSRPFQAG